MKNLLKKTILIAAVLTLTLAMSGCARKGTPLEISQTATASAQGIINGIANMDDYSADQMLDLETDEIEEFFAQYGYSLDGEAFVNGLNSFRDAAEAMGGVKGIGEPQMSSDDKEITAVFLIEGNTRNATATIVLNRKNKIVSITTNAHYTTGENIEKALLNTVLGMGTTFVILIFLSLIISLFKFIPEIQAGFEKKKEPASAPAVDKTISQIIEKEEQVSVSEADDGELIAVISAAIAAYEAGKGGTVSPSGDGFVVRSIRRR